MSKGPKNTVAKATFYLAQHLTYMYTHMEGNFGGGKLYSEFGDSLQVLPTVPTAYSI